MGIDVLPKWVIETLPDWVIFSLKKRQVALCAGKDKKMTETTPFQNAYDQFIPEVWSKRLESLMLSDSVMLQCVNRNYEGEIVNAGDTVNILTPGAVSVSSLHGSNIDYNEITPTKQQLVISQKKIFAFKINDVATAQAAVDLMEAHLVNAKKAIEVDQDSYLLGLHTNADSANIIGTSSAPTTITTSNIYSVFVELAKKLKKSNAIKDGTQPWVIINPDVEAVLLQCQQFTGSFQVGEKTIRDGAIGRIAGLDVLVSSNLKADTNSAIPVMAGTNAAITFASQVAKIEKMLEDYEIKEIDDYNQTIIDSNVTISNSASEQLINEIIQIPIDYAYSDLYDVETAYQRYLQIPAYDGIIQPIMANGYVDAQQLYDLVIKNNVAYKDKNPYSIYTELDKNYIAEYCQVIADTVNDMLNKGWDYNLEDLSYNLQHLCMFKSATGANASITDDGCMTVMPSNLDMMVSISNNENAGLITLSHETVHLFQRLSTEHRDQVGVKSAYGFCYEFDDLEVNSLYNRWFEEAAAENLAAKLHDSDPTTYANYISYLNTLKFVHGLNDNFDVNSLEQISVQNDVSKLFEAFNCNTEEDKMELLKVLYAINIIQVEPDDFMSLYEKEILGHEMSDEELVQLKIELKVGLSKYFSRTFYDNLISKMSSQSVKLEDVFELISTLESTLSTHILYTDESRYDTIKPFLDYYQNIQSAFFQVLANELGLSIDDIEAAYNAFNGKMEIKTNNILNETVYDAIEIPWVNDDMGVIIQEKHDTTSRNKTISINEYIKLKQNEKIY